MKLMNCFAALFALMLPVCAAYAQDDLTLSWSRKPVDGRITGVRSAGPDDVEEAMGFVSRGKYHSPSGRIYGRKSSVTKAAALMIEAQESMKEVKQVIAYSTREMVKHGPESSLSNWFIDALMASVSELSGKKVDIGFTNFGGIRVDMPKGDVLLDDILSMFPFRNNLCYLELKGRDVRVILEQMASTGWQVIGGVRCKATRSGRLLGAEVNGEPLDDEKVYGVATVSFLLDGGDGYSIARNALRLDIHPQVIIDAMLPYVKSLTAAGKNIEYCEDGRVEIVD
ncbi:MAG: 5'-nucleotidase C-terminal domain-containing protein [Candidatus Cryptobacteroides sp.]